MPIRRPELIGARPMTIDSDQIVDHSDRSFLACRPGWPRSGASEIKGDLVQRRTGQRRAPAITAALVTGTLIGTGVSATAVIPAYADVPVGEVYVSDLPWLSESNGWGPIERDTSNGESAAGDGRPITIGGVVYEKGIGMHATGALSVELGANCTSFSAFVGLDDEVTSGIGTTRF